MNRASVPITGELEKKRRHREFRGLGLGVSGILVAPPNGTEIKGNFNPNKSGRGAEKLPYRHLPIGQKGNEEKKKGGGAKP